MKSLWYRILGFLCQKMGYVNYLQSSWQREKARADREKARADKLYFDSGALFGEICKAQQKQKRTRTFAQAQVLRIKNLKEQLAKDRAYIQELKETIAGMERVL